MKSVSDIKNSLKDFLLTKIAIKALIVCEEDPFECFLVNSKNDLDYPIKKSIGGYIRVEIEDIAELFYSYCDPRAGGHYGFSHQTKIEGVLIQRESELILQDVVYFEVETSEGIIKLINHESW